MTKEQYLAEAAAWKQSYKDLTIEIRAAKHAYKDAQIAFAKAGGDRNYRNIDDHETRAYWAAHQVVQDMMWAAAKLKHKATEEIEYRHVMKRDAARDAQFSHEGRAKI